MFKNLRLRLTVLYAGLFAAAFVLIGATTYALIAAASERTGRTQLATAGAVFERMATLQNAHLLEAVGRTSRAETLRQALIDQNATELHTVLTGLRARAGVDRAFIVTPEGLVIDEEGAGVSSVSPDLQRVLARQSNPAGFMTLDGAMHRLVAAPVHGASSLGWVVAADRIDESVLDGLDELAGIPMEASIWTQDRRGGWGAEGALERESVGAFIDRRLAGGRASTFIYERERSLGDVVAFATLDGGTAALLLSYPRSRALSPFSAVFNSLAVIGIVGLGLLIVGSWFLARGITQPLSTLEASARNLREGVYEPVVVRTKDEISRLAASFNAMIDAIRQREQRITHLAYHDAETRLPNRLALERRLAAATQPGRLYLAAIGVDRFADVRGAIGYAQAAALMQRLGARLGRLAPNGPLARLSSDVLGIAFIAESEDAARKRAEALVGHLEQPFSIDGHVIDINVSVGIAQPRCRDETPGAMIERASVALDQARTARLRTSFFDKAAYGDPARNLSLMSEMRNALANGDMRIVLQPKFNFATGRIDSAEALVRWRHPTRGFISPDLFVPMAEETGHIRVLTEWVLRTAVREQRVLAEAGWPLALSVNVSGRLLDDASFAEAALAIAGKAAHPLCFEVTETAVIDNPKQALENIERFADRGVRIAIDDYGSGLSSLAYLKQMPAHELKIDKMFVQTITASERDALLVRSTIELAHGLGMEVTAEGVETPAAFALLAGMGCDLAQGYLISRPAPAGELLTLLNDKQRLRFYQQTARAGATVAPVLDTKSA